MLHPNPRQRRSYLTNTKVQPPWIDHRKGYHEDTRHGPYRVTYQVRPPVNLGRFRTFVSDLSHTSPEAAAIYCRGSTNQTKTGWCLRNISHPLHLQLWLCTPNLTSHYFPIFFCVRSPGKTSTLFLFFISPRRHRRLRPFSLTANIPPATRMSPSGSLKRSFTTMTCSRLCGTSQEIWLRR